MSAAVTAVASSSELTRGTASPRVLFLRGESGSGGLGSAVDSHLCDITDASTASGNHGWKTLADQLEADGFELVQRIEGSGVALDVDLADLDTFDVLVLGSNNGLLAAASDDAVALIDPWVRAGGGLLVISDANFGATWGDAPSADQLALDEFGLVMNQDLGTYTVDRGDGEFTAAGATHPILDGVDTFDGEGVSPISLGDVIPSDTTVTILAPAQGLIRNNDATGLGSTRSATADDAALLVADVGDGRLVGHFDRNTFFNANGAGTDITRFDNATLAINLFRWLADFDGAVIFADGFESGNTTAW